MSLGLVLFSIDYLINILTFLLRFRTVAVGIGFSLLASCTRPATDLSRQQPILRPTPTAHLLVGVVTRVPLETELAPGIADIYPEPAANAGMLVTLSDYKVNAVFDPGGAKADAFDTLYDFTRPLGKYHDAWWFDDDGQADIYEALAVIFFTEGHRSEIVRRAVAARYLWYCGGYATACSGTDLMNFLAYFQPWIWPDTTNGNFTHPTARSYLALAEELVGQTPGTITDWIPGADLFVSDPGIEEYSSPVNWGRTPFHFANVHLTWDIYLREKLGRGPDGPDRLWVLTMGEATRVCPSATLCNFMARERAQ